MKENFATLVNFLWKKCIENLNASLSEEERGKFSNNDYYYLLVIHSLDKPNFTELANALKVTKPGVTAIIRKLMKMGLVDKEQSAEDGRFFYITLTPKGEDIINGDRRIYEWVADRIKELAGDEQEIEILERIIKLLVADLVQEEF